MKEISKKDAPAVSGGTQIPTDSPCFPPFPGAEDYPRAPAIPLPDEPLCPETTEL